MSTETTTATLPVAAAVAATATAAAVAAAIYLYRLTKPRSDDPPCPGSYPIIGSFRHLGRPLHRFLAKKYPDDDVVLLFLGPSRLYVLNSYAAFKEAMVDNAEALSGRASQRAVEMMFGDRGGLVGSDGELWRKYRRFTLQTLRDFGLGRKGAESCITLESEDLCRQLEASNGKPIDLSYLFATNVSNVICQLVFGSRLASESEEFSKILHFFYRVSGDPTFQENNFRSVAYMSLTLRFDFILRLLLMLPDARNFTDMFQYLVDFCQKQVDRHLEDLVEGAEPRDYIDAHLQHQKENPEFFNTKRLSFAILDLFLAGTETTTNTLRWAVVLMIANPQVAVKVHQEIVSEVGANTAPNMGHKQHLHYTMATLEEISRYAALVAMGVMHRTTEDITVCGYRLPADSFVMFNLYHMHYDSKYFEKPHEFRPERHLDGNGHFHACQRLVSFGAGRRACLGESLARMELFLFFTALMQRFRFSLADDKSAEELLDMPEEYLSTLVRSLPSFEVRVHEW